MVLGMLQRFVCCMSGIRSSLSWPAFGIANSCTRKMQLSSICMRADTRCAESPPWLQVTAEGGTDAAQEAPYIYAALDALAARAAAWADHRQRNLISAAPQGAADSMLLPEAVGRQAAEVVRQVGSGLSNPDFRKGFDCNVLHHQPGQ